MLLATQVYNGTSPTCFFLHLFTIGKSCELSEGTESAILRLHKSGHSLSEIAVSLCLNSQTVWYVVQKFKGRGTVSAGKRSGRPRKTDSCFDCCLKSLSLKDVSKLGQEMAVETGIKVSNRTIQRQLCTADLYSFVSKKKPFISERNRKKRLAFAREHQH